jgi:hypothetical protein
MTVFFPGRGVPRLLRWPSERRLGAGRKGMGLKVPPLEEKEGSTCGRAFRLFGESGDGYLAVAARALALLAS